MEAFNVKKLNEVKTKEKLLVETLNSLAVL
jgi:hypothetical protein